MLHKALKQYGHVINFDELFLEGYIVLNPESKVAEVTQAQTALNEEDLIAYAQMVDQLYHLPIMYIEYSGIYGDVEKVKSVAETLTSTQLFYGGGISTLSEAQQMANYAHTIVVGDLIYTDIKQALKTVKIKKEFQ